MKTLSALHENGVSTGSSDKPTTSGAGTVAAIATAIPSELPCSSVWTSHMEKFVLPQAMLGHCVYEGKSCTGQLVASVPLLTLIPCLLMIEKQRLPSCCILTWEKLLPL